MDSFFCAIYHLKSLINDPTCYKNPDKPTCIDLIFTNFPLQFQAMLALETGLSNFHKMAVAAFKSEFLHQRPKIISYRSYKQINRNNFKDEIKNTIITQKISHKYLAFKNIVLETLNLYAPLKIKYLQVKHSSFIKKDLSKAIIHRSKLRKQFFKSQIHESRLRYNKEKNLCVTLLRKAEKEYYTDLKMSDINDNKKF